MQSNTSIIRPMNKNIFNNSLLNNFIRIHTIGDGSCLIHAIFFSLNIDNYRNKDRNARMELVKNERAELADEYYNIAMRVLNGEDPPFSKLNKDFFLFTFIDTNPRPLTAKQKLNAEKKQKEIKDNKTNAEKLANAEDKANEKNRSNTEREALRKKKETNVNNEARNQYIANIEVNRDYIKSTAFLGEEIMLQLEYRYEFNILTVIQHANRYDTVERYINNNDPIQNLDNTIIIIGNGVHYESLGTVPKDLYNSNDGTTIEEIICDNNKITTVFNFNQNNKYFLELLEEFKVNRLNNKAMMKKLNDEALALEKLKNSNAKSGITIKSQSRSQIKSQPNSQVKSQSRSQIKSQPQPKSILKSQNNSQAKSIIKSRHNTNLSNTLKSRNLSNNNPSNNLNNNSSNNSSNNLSNNLSEIHYPKVKISKNTHSNLDDNDKKMFIALFILLAICSIIIIILSFN
jgi:hypothetical protein